MPSTRPAPTLESMTAQPIHQEDPDPQDPEVILARLPERERDVFLSQYWEAARAIANDLVGYKQLKNLLHAWSIRAQVVSRPGYHGELEAQREAIRNGTVQTVPFFEAIEAELARRES